MTMLDQLVREKVESDDAYEAFLSAEICGDCARSLGCDKCEYNNILYSTNGGEKHDTARKNI